MARLMCLPLNPSETNPQDLRSEFCEEWLLSLDLTSPRALGDLDLTHS